jgi:hypothetical protein
MRGPTEALRTRAIARGRTLMQRWFTESLAGSLISKQSITSSQRLLRRLRRLRPFASGLPARIAQPIAIASQQASLRRQPPLGNQPFFATSSTNAARLSSEEPVLCTVLPRRSHVSPLHHLTTHHPCHSHSSSQPVMVSRSGCGPRPQSVGWTAGIASL